MVRLIAVEREMHIRGGFDLASKSECHCRRPAVLREPKKLASFATQQRCWTTSSNTNHFRYTYHPTLRRHFADHQIGMLYDWIMSVSQSRGPIRAIWRASLLAAFPASLGAGPASWR